jgi:hypothetical protein
LGTTRTNQNSIQEEIKSRLKPGNVCCLSVQNVLVFNSLSSNLKMKIYRTVILPVVLYGCEAWSLRMREKRRLRELSEEVRGEWRILNNEEFNYLYYSLNYSGDQIEKNELDVSCSTYGERRGVYSLLVGKPEGKRPLGRTRSRFGDSMKWISWK